MSTATVRRRPATGNDAPDDNVGAASRRNASSAAAAKARQQRLPFYDRDADDDKHHKRHSGTLLFFSLPWNMIRRVGLAVVLLVWIAWMVLSRHPCWYLCSSKAAPVPDTLPRRSEAERLAFIEDQIRHHWAFLPLLPTELNLQKHGIRHAPLHHNYTHTAVEDWYNVLECPLDHIPPKYPTEFPILGITRHWPVADTQPLATRYLHQGVCLVDMAKPPPQSQQQQQEDTVITRQQQINLYIQHQLPVVIHNDPRLLKTVETWYQPHYLEHALDRRILLAEVASTTHNNNVNWHRPMTFDQWYGLAWSAAQQHEHYHRAASPELKHFLQQQERLVGREHVTVRLDATNTNDQSITPPSMAFPFWGTRLDSVDDVLQQEMPYFYYHDSANNSATTSSKQDWIRRAVPDNSNNIECRLVAPGVAIPAVLQVLDRAPHLLSVFSGDLRVILAHPKQCDQLYLSPPPPPHQESLLSRVDWTNPNLTAFPEFVRLHASEVVLQPGDVLYVPPYWFYTVVHLHTTYQCAVRGSSTTKRDSSSNADIYGCGGGEA